MKLTLQEIPSHVRTLRIEKGLSQMELANKSGVSQQTISLLENGYINVSLKTLVKILNALGYGIILNKR